MLKQLLLFAAGLFCFSHQVLGQTTCNNEDFEIAGLTYSVPSNVTINTSTAVIGWTVNSGTVSTTAPDPNCTLTSSTFTKNPDGVKVISTGTAGLVDSRIGPGYPIYSIFGGSLNTNATSAYGFNSYGDWFIKINEIGGSSTVNRLTKSFNVTASNAMFNFAYLAVMDRGHGCCDAAGVSVVFKDCLGTVFATYSVSGGTGFPAGSVACSIGNTDTTISETTNDTTIVHYDSLYASPFNANIYYSKWIKRKIDLSSWIGNCIKVEVSAFDCVYNAHFGYAYFDAECGPASTTGLNSSSKESKIKVYPNPNTGQFNLQIEQPIINGEIELRDILGRIVYWQSIRQGNNQIKTENLSKGIYSYSILSDKKVVSTDKIVIE